MALDVALIGGSFNPPHLGHLMASLFMRSAIGVDEVWLVPAFHHPFGKPLEAFEDRVAMCQAMSADLGPWLKVSQAEASVGKEGRTIELLEWLLPRHPDTHFRWVIGSDILGDLHKWRAWERIEALVEVTVLNRPGAPSPRAVGPALVEVSSTAIRAALEQGSDTLGLLPRSVAAYVRTHGLYRRAP